MSSVDGNNRLVVHGNFNVPGTSKSTGNTAIVDSNTERTDVFKNQVQLPNGQSTFLSDAGLKMLQNFYNSAGTPITENDGVAVLPHNDGSINSSIETDPKGIIENIRDYFRAGTNLEDKT